MAFTPSATTLKRLINLWPPFLGAGIRVLHISADFRAVEVMLKLGLTNRNYVGVHFGGSLYAMTDPFYMLMLMQVLGRDYVVWDKIGSIEYVQPGRGRVYARFRLDDATLDSIRAACADGGKVLPELEVDVVDEGGQVVARVRKTLYVRRKMHAPATQR